MMEAGVRGPAGNIQQKKHAHKNLVYGEPEDDKRVPRKIPRRKLVYKKRSRKDGIT